MNRTAGNAPTASRPPSGERERGSGKRGEPHGRQRGATNSQPPRGENRRGGEKPRGRNRMSTGGTVGPNPRPITAERSVSAPRPVRVRGEWMRGWSFGEGVQGGRIPGEEEPTAGSTWSARRLGGKGREGLRPRCERSEGETRGRGGRCAVVRHRADGGHGTTSRAGPATAQGRGGVRGRPTTRYRVRRRGMRDYSQEKSWPRRPRGPRQPHESFPVGARPQPESHDGSNL